MTGDLEPRPGHDVAAQVRAAVSEQLAGITTTLTANRAWLEHELTKAATVARPGMFTLPAPPRPPLIGDGWDPGHDRAWQALGMTPPATPDAPVGNP